MNHLLAGPLFDYIIKGIIAVWVFIIGYILVIRLVNRFKGYIREQNQELEQQHQEHVAELVGTIVYVTLMILNVLVAMQVAGFQVGILMAWISFWVGFGLQQILGNMIAGVLIITNKKFRIGDTIQIEDFNLMGKIKTIKLRYTIIKTFDRRRVIIPNLKLLNSAIKTFSAEALIRWFLDVYIGISDNTSYAKQKLLTIINAHPDIQEKAYTYIALQEFRSSGITLRAYFYANPKGPRAIFLIKSDLRTTITKELYDEVNIHFPYEHMTLDTKEIKNDILKELLDSNRHK